MLTRIKSSLTTKFTLWLVVSTIILLGGFSALFFHNMNSLSYDLARAKIDGNMRELRSHISSSLGGYESLIQSSGDMITALLGAGAVITEEHLSDSILQIRRRIPEVGLMYFYNNVPWGQPGSFRGVCRPVNLPEGWDNTQRPWFLNANRMPRGVAGFSDPYVDVVTGELVISVSLALFDRAGTNMGVVAADIRATDIHEAVSGVYTVPGQHVYLLNADGLFIAHPDQAMIMAANFFTETGTGGYRARIAAMDYLRTTVQIDGEDMDFFAAKIPLVGWYLVSVTPYSAIFAETGQLFRRLVFVLIAIITLVSIMVTMVTKNVISRPLWEMRDTAMAIADMNFSQSISLNRSDEVGETQKALMKIRDNLKKSMDDVNNHLNKATESSKNLGQAVMESSSALGVITDNIETTLTEASNQTDSVVQTSNFVEKIVTSINSLEDVISAQASNITESSVSIKDMVNNVDSLRSTMNGVGKIVETLEASSNNGRSTLGKLEKEVQQIQKQSAALHAANSAISDIANNTNILAMNAAIEAARAGDSGKGFAVVAGEIRKLAELASRESERISEEIKKIEQGVNKVTNATGETVASMDTIFDEIRSLEVTATEVSAAVEKQAASGEQVLSSLKSMQEMTEKVRSRSHEIQRQSGSISSEMNKLQQISENVTKQVNQVDIAGKKIASFLESTRAMISA